MIKVKEFLEGKKTGIQVTLALGVIGLFLGGFVEAEHAGAAIAALGFGTQVSLGARTNRLAKEVK